MSHDHLGWTEGGFFKNIAFMKRTTNGCSPKLGDTDGCNNDEMADL